MHTICLSRQAVKRICSIVLMVVVGSLSAQTPLFQNAARAKPARVSQVELPLFLDGKELQPLRVQLNGNTLHAVHKAQLYTLLSARLLPEALGKIEAIWSDTTIAWLTPAAAFPMGVILVYDASKVQLSIEIPLPIRRAQVLRFNERFSGNMQASPFIEPEPQSFILNTRTQLQASNTTANTSQLQYINLAGAWRYSPWVLQADVSAQHKTTTTAGASLNESYVTRGDVVLIRDNEQDLARLSVGDVTARSLTSTASNSVLGINYQRLYDLDPLRGQYAKPSQVLSLPAGAAVDVYVNGTLARSLRLEAGVHDLQQLPVNSGANDVNIRVIEPGKPAVWYKQSFFFDTQLLSEEGYDFQWSLGVPKQSITSLGTPRQYDTRDVQFTTAHRYGISSSLTAGLGLHVSQKSWRTSTEWLTPLAGGIWANELTYLTHTPDYLNTTTLNPIGHYESGWQYKSQWLWRAKREPRKGFNNPSISVQGTYRTGTYLNPIGVNAARLETGVRLGVNYGENHNLNVSVRDDNFLDGRTQTLYASWSYKINPAWTLDTVFSQSSNHRSSNILSNDALGKRLLISLRWHPGSDGLSSYGVTTGFDVYQNKRFIDYHQQDATDNGIWRLNANAAYQGVNASLNQLTLTPDQSLSDSSMQNIRASYIHSRFEAEAQFDRYDYTLHNYTAGTQTRDLTQTAALYFSNAIGYTQGQWFVSRPIADSAAIVKAHPKLTDSGLFVVDPHPAAAKQDGYGAPVVAPLSMSIKQELVFDAERLKQGQNLGNDRFTIRPQYRSITLIPIGVSAQTQVTGVVLDAQGKPSKLTPLFIYSLNKEDSYDVFTNRMGVFFSPALKPGQYQLTTIEDEVIASFQVEEDSPWKINLNTLEWPKNK